jgi:hypothetical protein
LLEEAPDVREAALTGIVESSVCQSWLSLLIADALVLPDALPR